MGMIGDVMEQMTAQMEKNKTSEVIEVEDGGNVMEGGDRKTPIIEEVE